MNHAQAEQIRDLVLDEVIAPASMESDAVASESAIAVGISEDNGSYKLAVRVQTMSAAAEAALEAMAKMAGGEMDVRETGPIVGLQLWRHTQQRPLLIGGSCANRAGTNGTLGCFVRRNSDNALCILSANHVLVHANEVNLDGSPAAGTQLTVDQPSPDDFAGGAQVGSLVQAVRLRLQNNMVDAAIARVPTANPAPNLSLLTGFGQPLSNVPVASAPNQIVHKIGRTTELRTGRISAHGLKNLTVTIDGVPRGFDQQIEIESIDQNFSEGGDSGAIVFDASGHPVGLLFGGSLDNRLSYASPIAEVLSALQVRIVTS